jgi:hypothetical protein
MNLARYPDVIFEGLVKFIFSWLACIAPKSMPCKNLGG